MFASVASRKVMSSHPTVVCSAEEKTGKLLRNALRQPKAGSNLKLLAAGNFLRSLGVQNQADVTRVLDICTNPNSLFGTKRGKSPMNPYVSKRTSFFFQLRDI